MGIVTQMKNLMKDAIGSSKIKFSRPTLIPDENVNNQNGDRLEPAFWEKFQNKVSDWKEFELQELYFRMNLSTKPLLVDKEYVHLNPSTWFKIISVLSSVFYTDKVFRDIRPDGQPFSLEFLRYVKRIMKKFPITFPNQPSFNALNTERQHLIEFIEFSINFVKEKIQPCFRLNRYRNEEESRTVEKDELTHLWTTMTGEKLDLGHLNAQ